MIAEVGRDFTVIVIVAVVAHCPASGANVYVVVFMLSSAGDHIPVMPFVDVVGSALTASPAQMDPTGVNAGVTFELTVMVIVAVVAHCPASGINVYVVVFVLSSAGDHVPVMPLVEVVGNAAKAAPEQIGPTALKVGATSELTVTVTVPLLIQAPEVSETEYTCVVPGLAVTEVPVVALNPVAGLQL